MLKHEIAPLMMPDKNRGISHAKCLGWIFGRWFCIIDLYSFHLDIGFLQMLWVFSNVGDYIRAIFTAAWSIFSAISRTCSGVISLCWIFRRKAVFRFSIARLISTYCSSFCICLRVLKRSRIFFTVSWFSSRCWRPVGVIRYCLRSSALSSAWVYWRSSR